MFFNFLKILILWPFTFYSDPALSYYARITCDRTLYCGSLARVSSFRCKIIIFSCKILMQPQNAFLPKNFLYRAMFCLLVNSLMAMFCLLANSLFQQGLFLGSQLSKVEGVGCRMFLWLCFPEMLQKREGKY